MQHAVDRGVWHSQLTVREQFACNPQQESVIRRPQLEIRQRREKHQSIRGLVPARVEEYILGQALYR